ncbi:PAS domain S-box-containing protein [Alteromonadaceae bacterium 2753L.S.0a.02]|nr:PAS domain S-box-containing protein [Alteromonadaceae bacterium 2753L.S.0a.02]
MLTNINWLFITIISVQSLVLLFVLFRRFPGFDLGRSPPSLQKTKHQLYREIARHEVTEELLRETQQYLNCMINSMPAILIGITPDGYITHWNHSAEKVTGLSSEEATGSHIEQAFPSLPLDKSVIDETVRSGIPYSRKNIKDGSGAQARFTNLTIYPLVSPEIRGAVIIAEDVTPRVRMENLLIQNEKMMGLGELAAGVAHEINNPLAAILSNAQNIERRTSTELDANAEIAAELGVDISVIRAYLDEREIPDFIENIRNAGDRAAKIVKNLLEFSRGERNHQFTNLQELISHSLDLAHKNFELETPDGVEFPAVIEQINPNVGPISCSASEIQQVLLNLLRNAAQALKSKDYGPPLNPEITISLDQSDSDVIIEVSDNGPGMTEEVLTHIFEPFYTTKDVGKGTGLGLSVSYFIIKEHHQGIIEAESKPGDGTRFRIKLPRMAGGTTVSLEALGVYN